VRRRAYLVLIVLAIALFVVVSALLARAFSVEGAERSAITTFVQAEARGDVNLALGQIQDCRASSTCTARVTADVAALRHGGAVSIIQIQPSAGFSLTGTNGTARVAWNVGGSLPIVQCMRVRRAGNVVSGLRVELLAVTPRIRSDADCPATF
jgi:hypothetical protein